MSLTACTIAARHELPLARALAASLSTLSEPVALHVLVLDDRHRQVDASREPFGVMTPGELDVPRYEMLAAIHARSELVEVLRPALLRAMLARVEGPTVLLDVDSLARVDLAPLELAITEAEMALVPATLAAIPRDHVHRTDQDQLKHGIVDRGLLAVRAGTAVDEFLRQWSDRIELDRADEIPLAAARFADLALAFVPGVALVRDPGLGLSVHNLHERPLTWAEQPLCAGRPLRLTHFTGLAGEPPQPGPDIVPGADGPMDGGRVLEADRAASPQGLREQAQRELVARTPALAALLRERDDAVREAGGAGVDPPEYGYARLSDGAPLGRRLRRLIRDAEMYGGLTGSPCDVAGTESFYSWCNAPAEHGARNGITRFWYDVYRDRPDLQIIHPDLDGDGGPGFVRWQVASGVEEYAVPPMLHPLAG